VSGGIGTLVRTFSETFVKRVSWPQRDQPIALRSSFRWARCSMRGSRRERHPSPVITNLDFEYPVIKINPVAYGGLEIGDRQKADQQILDC